jgi:hypothetical protein
MLLRMTGRGILNHLLLAAAMAGTACTPAGREADRAAAPVASTGTQAPRLIVLVIIDMFRADYLTRFADRFGAGGFLRLLAHGARCDRCVYPYAVTETAPGNATLATGTTPDRHGIVGNAWYGALPGSYGAAVDDPRHPHVGGASDLSGASPRHLLAATLGDQLSRLSGGRSKVFGVAGKDRAAILSSGHSAAGAYWLDRYNGRFMSSTYYGEHLPRWVESFNDRLPIDRYAGRTWEMPGGEPMTLPATVDAQGAFFFRFAQTPYLDRQIAEFARELIVHEELGADGDVDFLAIGLSGHDWLGHEVGPYHPAIAALAEQTDALLADLLRFLDDRIGAGGYWLAVTSDHGVVPTVEQARERGLPGRVLDQEALRQALLGARWTLRRRPMAGAGRPLDAAADQPGRRRAARGRPRRRGPRRRRGGARGRRGPRLLGRRGDQPRRGAVRRRPSLHLRRAQPRSAADHQAVHPADLRRSRRAWHPASI